MRTCGGMIVGQSVQHRPIVATRVGDRHAPARVLVGADGPGNERAGERIVARLERAHPDGVRLWLIRSANPDGVAAGTRQNAHAFDLTGNSPFRCRAAPRGTFFPGPAPASEPETRAIMRLVRRIRPQLAIFYHQHMRIVVRARGADPALQRAYSRRVGLPLRVLPRYHGTAVSWENRVVRGGSAFVAELPAGPADARRHARAVLALARQLSASAASSAGSDSAE